MSSLSKTSKTQNTQTKGTSEQAPWGPQDQELRFAFDEAHNAYKTATGAAAPNGFVAQFSPEQLGVFQKMMQAAGMDLPNAASGAVSPLINAGVSGTTGALSDLGAFTPKGGTDYNIAAATQYANNPAVDGMIDAAMRDSRRQVSEQALPAIARGAAATGNINSSRRAISEGLVERGLAEKTADVSSNIRGQMFDQGLRLAQSEADASNSAVLQAMLGRLSGGNQAVGAGLQAGSSSVDQLGGLYDIAGKGVAGTLAGTQAGLDEQMAKYQFGTNSPFDALNNFWNIIGSANWGGNTKTTGTSNITQTNQPSTMDTIGKVISTAGELGKWFTSDRNAKTDIKKIGELCDGLPVYRFRYKSDPTRVHIGLMAQDVEKIYPHAVGQIYGVKHVDYDAATALAAQIEG